MISQRVIEQSRAVVVVLGLVLTGCAAGFPAGEDPGTLVPSSNSSTTSSGLTGIAGSTGTQTAIGIGTSGAQPGANRAGAGGGAGVMAGIGMTGAADAGTRISTPRTGGSGAAGAAGMDRTSRAGSGAGDAGVDAGASQDACQRLARCCNSLRNSAQDTCRTISQANDGTACDRAVAMYCN
jgi:hypothetical protein